MESAVPTDRASIIRFPSRKRGRPKSMRQHIDTGTPELSMKRRMGETTETLDFLLEKGLITPEQHWCGIHLRWLYTLRFGAPGIRALDLTSAGGMEVTPDDPQWRSEREKEYNEAMQCIVQSGHSLLLVNVCIYNQRCTQGGNDMERLRAGLDALCILWRRKNVR